MGKSDSRYERLIDELNKVADKHNIEIEKSYAEAFDEKIIELEKRIERVTPKHQTCSGCGYAHGGPDCDTF